MTLSPLKQSQKHWSKSGVTLVRVDMLIPADVDLSIGHIINVNIITNSSWRLLKNYTPKQTEANQSQFVESQSSSATKEQ